MPTLAEDTSRRSQRGKGAPAMMVSRAVLAVLLLAFAGPALAQNPGAEEQEKTYTLEESIQRYDGVIRQVEETIIPKVRTMIAEALYEKARTWQRANRLQEAVATYDDLLRQFQHSSFDDHRRIVANTLINRGVAVTKLGRVEEALAGFDEVLDILAERSDGEARQGITLALYNKACGYALLGNVTLAIENLSLWRESAGGFNCAKIDNDSDFNRIRNDPTFYEYMKTNSCTAF